MKLRFALLCAALFGVAPVMAKEESHDVRWLTLGTAGGPILHQKSAQISNALVVGDSVYLFDLGNSVLRQMDGAHLNIAGVRAAFISHHHDDHNADTGLVIMTHWLFNPNKTLQVIGARGTEALVAGLVQANEATTIASFDPVNPKRRLLSQTVSAKDVPSGLNEPYPIYSDEKIKVFAIEVAHYRVPPNETGAYAPSAIGFRIEAAGKIYVYTGDTGHSDNLIKLAKGADVLVSEISLDPPEQVRASFRRFDKQQSEEILEKRVSNNLLNHLQPEQIGLIAKAAGVKEIVLTHHNPVPTAEQEERALKLIRRVFTGRVYLARDLDSFPAPLAK